MLQRVRDILANLGLIGLWGISAVLVTLVAYQMYATLLFVGILAVENPAIRPAGWNTATIYGLSRFLILVLGSLWLVVVVFLRDYLREGMRQHQLRACVLRLTLFIGALYGVSYGVLLLLS